MDAVRIVSRASRLSWPIVIPMAAAALGALLVAIATSAASPTACRVRNLDAHDAYRSLQAAVDAASARDHLVVHGTCHGVTTIGRRLRISGVATPTSGLPTLDGDRRGSVISVLPGARVAILDVTIRDGRARSGGGIANRGRLTLRDVVVRDSSASVRGGGIYNGGRLTLNGSSLVEGNSVPLNPFHWGGGVSNGGTLTLNDSSSVRANTGCYSGGVQNQPDGVVVMNDRSVISGNTGWKGGGANNNGVFTLNDSSSIRENVATYWGAGASNRTGGLFVLNDSSVIAANSSQYSGGGVQVRPGATLVMNGSSQIIRNVAGTAGGGVSTAGILEMNGASLIRGNTSSDAGGGVYAEPGASLVGVSCAPAADANVRANRPDNCSSDAAH